MKHTGIDQIWDVIVIGGGASGMMAASSAGNRGKSVLLLEKNKTLGVKLLITGGGRCNVTNNKPQTREMLASYKGSDQFLFSAFTQFGVRDALAFFHERNMPTKEENEGRMFPASNKAKSVWDVLVREITDAKVVVQCNAAVRSIILQDDESFSVVLQNKNTYRARALIVATGGTSRPETGSTGDGFSWLSAMGHLIHMPKASLVPIAISDAWAKRLGGVTLSNIRLTTYQNDQKQESYKGKLLFTHFGISGPTVLNMSKDVGELLNYGDVEIRIDLFPALDPGALKIKVQELLVSESNKKIKNALASLVPSALVSPMLALASIDDDTPNHSVSSAQRKQLISTLKSVPIRVEALLGSDKAVVSSGGVDPKEIDFKTMQSRKIPNLYLVGDMLNIDRPSGGYSLQLCWTTGFIAGLNC